MEKCYYTIGCGLKRGNYPLTADSHRCPQPLILVGELECGRTNKQLKSTEPSGGIKPQSDALVNLMFHAADSCMKAGRKLKAGVQRYAKRIDRSRITDGWLGERLLTNVLGKRVGQSILDYKIDLPRQIAPSNTIGARKTGYSLTEAGNQNIKYLAAWAPKKLKGSLPYLTMGRGSLRPLEIFGKCLVAVW